ncbi:MAG: CvpA family protein [Desulfovibrio sp.]|nr:CvpA family protein [Desulfovibrio sp.]
MISILDIGLGILLLLFLVRGMLRGLISEMAGFAGIFLGFFLAGRFYPLVVPQFDGIISEPKWANGISYAVIFAASMIVVSLCSLVARRILTPEARLDSLLGALIGLGKGLFVCAVAIALMQRFVPDSPFLKKSVLAVHMDFLVVFARSLLPSFLN